ncbi:MAG: MoaD/ThiS family protein [Chloroflexota bacterium]
MKIEVSTVGLPLGNEQPQQEPMAQEQGSRRTMELPAGATVATLLERLGSQRKQVEMVIVNGKQADDATSLKDGDAVSLVGQVGGM